MDAMLGSYTREMSVGKMRQLAPSIFAVEPWERMSDRYLMFPTYDIIKEMSANGLIPVSVMQSRTRIEGKADYTKHMVKFQHRDMQTITREMRHIGDVYPQVILTNSHDGTSAYRLDMGLFRLVCLNGMMVSAGDIDSISCRHKGKAELIGEVIDASYSIINSAPKILESVNRWNGLMLPPPMQSAYAEAALELRESDLQLDPQQLLTPKRWEDGSSQQNRSLWQTFNIVQEHLVKGGDKGTSATGRRIRTREVKNIDKDTKLNKALWSLTEKMGELVSYGKLD